MKKWSQAEMRLVSSKGLSRNYRYSLDALSVTLNVFSTAPRIVYLGSDPKAFLTQYRRIS